MLKAMTVEYLSLTCKLSMHVMHVELSVLVVDGILTENYHRIWIPSPAPSRTAAPEMKPDRASLSGSFKDRAQLDLAGVYLLFLLLYNHHLSFVYIH